MEIRKIAGISPDDRAAMERVFAEIKPRPVACCNWPGEFPYAPEVSFRMFHTGDWLMLRSSLYWACVRTRLCSGYLIL